MTPIVTARSPAARSSPTTLARTVTVAWCASIRMSTTRPRPDRWRPLSGLDANLAMSHRGEPSLSRGPIAEQVAFAVDACDRLGAGRRFLHS